jgi:hypothetical protein
MRAVLQEPMKSDASIYAKWALTSAALLALTACGANGDGDTKQLQNAAQPPEATATAEASKGPNPCNLLTDDEINAELATKHQGPYKISRKGLSYSDASTGSGRCYIEIKNDQGDTAAFAITQDSADFESVAVIQGTRTPIPGIGKQAFEVRRLCYYAFVKGQIVGIAAGALSHDSSIKLLRAAAGRV